MSASSVTTLAAFIEEVKKLTARKGRRYAFRGEASIEWPLYPGIMRDGYERLWDNEQKATRDLISVHPNEFRDDHTMFDRLVRMQHFGLPTRLLDVTLNPLVALFNATEPHINSKRQQQDGRVYRFSIPHNYEKYFDSDIVSCISNLANMKKEERNRLFNMRSIPLHEFNDLSANRDLDRLIQFVRAEKSSFRPEVIGRELADAWYVIPKLSNRRIIAQSGAFIIHGLARDVEHVHRVGIAYRDIIIPAAAKSELRKELASMGITESALFPEIDKAAKLVRDRYSL